MNDDDAQQLEKKQGLASGDVKEQQKIQKKFQPLAKEIKKSMYFNINLVLPH